MEKKSSNCYGFLVLKQLFCFCNLNMLVKKLY